MDALQSCKEALSDAEELHLISRCIDSLAMKACSGPTPYNLNGISTSSKPQILVDDWWYKDVSFLGLNLYKRVIQAMETSGMKPKTIVGSLVGYTQKYIPLMNRQSSFNDAGHSKPVSAPSIADQRALEIPISRDCSPRLITNIKAHPWLTDCEQEQICTGGPGLMYRRSRFDAQEGFVVFWIRVLCSGLGS